MNGYNVWLRYFAGMIECEKGSRSHLLWCLGLLPDAPAARVAAWQCDHERYSWLYDQCARVHKMYGLSRW